MRFATVCISALIGFATAVSGALQDDMGMLRRAKSNMPAAKNGNSQGESTNGRSSKIGNPSHENLQGIKINGRDSANSGGQPVSAPCPSQTTFPANIAQPTSLAVVYGVATFNDYSTQKQQSGVNCCSQSRTTPHTALFTPSSYRQCRIYLLFYPYLLSSLLPSPPCSPQACANFISSI